MEDALTSLQTRFVASGFFALLAVPAAAYAQEPPPADPNAAAQPAPPPPPPVAAAPAPPAAPVAPPPAAQAPAEEDKDHPSPNSVFAEGLGAGLLYSVNYERLVIDQIGVRAGFSYYSFGASVSTSAGESSARVHYVQFPITASYIGLRGGKHSLEVGGGATILYVSGESSSGGLTASGDGMGAHGNFLLGYRLHPVDKAGFQFRIGLMALVGKGYGVLTGAAADKVGVLPWGYISFGASF
jgi:hypothetical protein